MAHTYMLFDFADEEKAQLARHKLEGWKQAFRLDKKLQFKFDRGEEAAPVEAPEEAETPKKAEKTKSKSRDKAKAKSGDESSAKNGPVKLLVRLYFSGHEKLSEQQWLDRIPADELFRGAEPKVVREGQPGFAEVLKQFDTLE